MDARSGVRCDEENVIRLELVIRREGVEVMNANLFDNADQGGIRVAKVVYPDHKVSFEIVGRSPNVQSRQELEAFLDDVARQVLGSFRFDDDEGGR